jgi:hypothetical protein
MNWKDNLALVTGASSGIGAATARRLAEAGMRVVLVARRVRRLQALQAEIEADGGQAQVVAADLSSEGERLRVYQQTGEIDVLVNNAGFGWYGYFNEMAWGTVQEMLQVNIGSAVHLTSLYLPGMLRRGRGHIINVGSISGSIPSQGIAIYSATKAFLDAFTTALYRETRNTRVRVSVVRAGPVQTEFGEIALQKQNGRNVPTERVGVSAAYVARRIWGLLQRPKRVIYIPHWLGVVPWLELSFGWLQDLIGPLLLKWKKS